MKFIKYTYPILILTFLFISCVEKQTADLVIVNGKIHTVDEKNSIVEALAVKDGKILDTGSSTQIKSYIGEETKTIPLEDGTGLKMALKGDLECIFHLLWNTSA